MARDASRPDALRQQRRAGTVKDAEGTAKRRSRRRPSLTVPSTVAREVSTGRAVPAKGKKLLVRVYRF
jgi:hypothetical protein